MANEELFNQTVETDFDDNDRLAASTPGAKGAKNMLWSAFRAKIESWFPDISSKANKDASGMTPTNVTSWRNELGVTDPVDISGKMDKISLPTTAQQLEMLTVDENGQAVGSGVYTIRSQTDFVNFMKDSNAITAIMESTVSLTLTSFEVIGLKRIIGEPSILEIVNDIEIIPSSSSVIVIEPIVRSTAISGRGFYSNSNDFAVSINIKRLDSTVSPKTFSLSQNGTEQLSLSVANNYCLITNNNAVITFESNYFISSDYRANLVSEGPYYFSYPRVYNSASSPATTNIVFNEQDARIGIIQKIYHNSGTPPTFSGVSDIQKVSQGEYAPSVLNIIFAEWVATDRVEYWIVQES